MILDNDYLELKARIDDKIRISNRGELAYTGFLDPMHIAYATDIVKQSKIADRAVFFGGYENFERARMFILPQYLVDMGYCGKEALYEYFCDEVNASLVKVKIQGSSYKNLSHRDYLGAVLSLGIERDAMGDVVVNDDFSAVIITSESIAKLILSELSFVGADKVRVSVLSPCEEIVSKHEFKRISDTLPSNRLDCVVGSLCSLSREKSQGLIKIGDCMLKYIKTLDVTKAVSCGDVISVKGYGKFIVVSIGEPTKKGRIRFVADKYI